MTVLTVYGAATPRDESFSATKIGHVPLDICEHLGVVCKALFKRGETVPRIRIIFEVFFDRFHAKRKEVHPTPNTSESDHKSDKENASIQESSKGNGGVESHCLTPRKANTIPVL